MLTQSIREIASHMLRLLVNEISSYCSYYSKCYNMELQSIGNDDFVDCDICIHKDDVTSSETLEDAFTRCGLSDINSRLIINQLKKSGRTLVSVNNSSTQEQSEYKLKFVEILNILTSLGLNVAVVKRHNMSLEKKVGNIIKWMTELSQTNDGMCRLVCEALAIPLILPILQVDPLLPRSVSSSLHNLFLTLMADQSFKLSFAVAYAHGYSAFSSLYGRGFGESEHSIYTLSVQFLNKESYVSDLVWNHNFFQSICHAFETMVLEAYNETLSAARSEFQHDNLNSEKISELHMKLFLEHKVTLHRRYNPLFGDLKVVFVIRFKC